MQQSVKTKSFAKFPRRPCHFKIIINAWCIFCWSPGKRICDGWNGTFGTGVATFESRKKSTRRARELGLGAIRLYNNVVFAICQLVKILRQERCSTQPVQLIRTIFRRLRRLKDFPMSALSGTSALMRTAWRGASPCKLHLLKPYKRDD